MPGQLGIFHTEAQIGDAAFTLYRVDFAPEQGENKASAYEEELRSSDYFDIYHSHFYYEMHVITGGEAHLCVDQTDYRISCGEIFIIPPHTAHFAIVRADRQASNIVLCLRMEQKGAETGEYARFMDTLQENSCIARPLSPELLYQFMALHSCLAGKRFRDHCRRQMLAYDVLVGLFEQFDGLRGPETFDAEDVSDKALFELENCINSAEKYSLQEIAERLGYAPRHTARLIRQLYGKNLQEIRQQSSIAAVRRMLVLYPDMSLREIADKTGFSGVAAMNRAFKESEGMLPAAWRKKASEQKTSFLPNRREG